MRNSPPATGPLRAGLLRLPAPTLSGSSSLEGTKDPAQQEKGKQGKVRGSSAEVPSTSVQPLSARHTSHSPEGVGGAWGQLGRGFEQGLEGSPEQARPGRGRRKGHRSWTHSQVTKAG